MECIREIIEPDRLAGILRMPKKMRESKVEVIVLPFDESREQSSLAEKLQAIDELNGLLADQDQEKLDEFEQIINERTPFRREPVHL